MNILSSIPIVGGAFDNSDEQALAQLKKNQQLYDGLNAPNFESYDPDAYQVAGTYTPEEAQANTVSEDPALRTAQMSVLSKLSNLGDTGLSDVDNEAFNRARLVGAQTAQSGNASAVQNANARGVGGSGLEFAMREAANQGGANAAQQAGLNQAAQAAQMRAIYQQAYGAQLGSVRGQDLNAGTTNANILNQFEMANTNNANQAQQYNLNNKQTVMNANTSNNNQAQQYNNQMEQQQYEDQLQKVSGEAGANTGASQGYAAENANNTSARNANTGLLGTAIGYLASGKPKKDATLGATT